MSHAKLTSKTTLKTTLNRTGDSVAHHGASQPKSAGVPFSAAVKAMVPGDELADPEHPGLRVRRVGEQRVFFYRYRIGSRLRQVEVAVLGATTLTAIRGRWEALRAQVRHGDDPRSQVKAERIRAAADRVAQRQRELTVEDVVELYLAENVEKARKAKGAAEARRLLHQFIRYRSWSKGRRERVEAGSATGRTKVPPAAPRDVVDVANMPAHAMTRERAHKLLFQMAESAPRSAGMARAELRGAWRHAIATGRLAGPSPFEMMPEHGKHDALGGRGVLSNSVRERYLRKDEAGQLLRWMAQPGTYSRTVRDALELVLRTGLRSGEVCGIHSSELERRDGVLWLNIPADRMKAGKAHTIPLMGRAEQIVLARLPEKPGHLFSSTKEPGRAIEQKVLGVEVYACSGRSKANAYKTRRVCPVSGWSPHDLRRTARSLLQELGCPYDVGEAILAHALPGVGAVYARSQLAEQKVLWLGKLNEHLDRLASARAALVLATQAA